MADDSAPTPPIISEAALDDQLAVTRALPIPDPATIPRPPDQFQPTSAEQRARRTRTVGTEVEAELMGGVEEYAARGDEVKNDLGEHAPPVEKAQKIAAEYQQVDAALTRANALVAYLEERKGILKSDALILLEAAKEEYDYHVKRKPHIAENHKRQQRFFDARSRAISEGIARSAKKKVEIEAAKKTGPTPPE